MSKDLQRLTDYLSHIVEAIERIEHYVVDLDEMGFLSSELVQDAVVRNFEIIREASHNIEKRYPEFVKQHPEIPFSAAYQMRNVIAHGYFKVDFELVWKTICNQLPEFYKLVKTASEF